MERDAAENFGRIYLSSTDPDLWEPDPDVGGFAHMLFDHGETKAGLWRSDPQAVQAAPTVEIPARETILVLEGSVRVAVDGGEPRPLRVGDMLSIPAGSLVGWDADAECKVFWVYS